MEAYAPVGSIERGRRIATTGGERSVECLTCHGKDLRGTALAPPIAGRQPSYIGRQLWDMKLGARNGTMAHLMKPAVEKLTQDDVIDIAAYVASVQP
jgi:cytochrome c553